jgi:DNA-binding GntR family transcriptional regulator
MLQNHIQPIEETSRTISRMVHERIRTAILKGALSPGAILDQKTLARDLNTSIVPVREALRKLESEGFVQIVPRRGAYVTEVSVEDMENLYQARAILEGQTAYQAAPLLTEGDIRKLEGLCAKMSSALHQEDYAAFTQLNRQFHFVIYDAVGNSYVSNMIAGLWELAERYRYRYTFFKDQADTIQAEHNAILEACQKRDSSTLQEAIVYHLNRTLSGIRTFIEQDL